MAIAFVSAAATVDGSGNATISHTTGSASVNDVLLITHSNNFFDITNMPTPTVNGSSTGVAAVTGGTADAGNNANHMKCYTFVVTSGGTQAISVTETGTANEEKALGAFIFSGVDTTTLVDVAGATTSITSDATHVLTAISPTTTNAMLVAMLSDPNNAGSYTAPGSMAERYDVTGAITVSGADEQLSASGTTGTRTFTPNSSSPWVGVMVALKTGTAGPATTLTFLQPLQVPQRRL